MEEAIAKTDPALFAEAFLSAWDRADPEVQVISSTKSSEGGVWVKGKEFLSKALSVISSKIADDRKKPIVIDQVDCGKLHLQADDLQLLEPRGRFEGKFYQDRVTLIGKQGSAMIMGKDISFMAVLPSTTSSKKEGEDILVIVLAKPTLFAGKEMTKFTINLSKSSSKILTSLDGDSNIESIIVCEAFRHISDITVDRPNPRLFTSSIQQKSFVRCHKGTQEGALYPLQAGIIFLKPVLFIGVDDIASITAGRGGGSGNTRYVDLKVETADDKVYEFVNIDRDELPALQGYVRNYLEARIRDKMAKQSLKVIPAGGSQKVAHAGMDDEDDDSDDEDDDYDPNKSDSDDNSGSDDDDDDDDDDEDNGANDKNSDDSGDDANDSCRDRSSKNVKCDPEDSVKKRKAETAVVKDEKKKKHKAVSSFFVSKSENTVIDLASNPVKMEPDVVEL